ncbi:hypothetical protein FKM82_003338 [Ascaphus truei]
MVCITKRVHWLLFNFQHCSVPCMGFSFPILQFPGPELLLCISPCLSLLPSNSCPGLGFGFFQEPLPLGFSLHVR